MMADQEREVAIADLEKIYAWAQQGALESFNEDGETHQQLFAVKLGQKPGDDPKIMAFDPRMMSVFYGSEQGKELLSGFMRDLLNRGSTMRNIFVSHGMPAPDVVVQISEAWTRSFTKEENDARDKKKAIADYDDRMEVILVALHTRDGTFAGFQPIDDNPRRATPGPLQIDLEVRGRLTMRDIE